MDRTVMTSLGEVEVLEALRVRAQDLYPEVVARYVEALQRGDRLPDLVVARLRERLLLIDGRHRIAAWETVGVPIAARVGWWIHDIGEALAMAIQANARHGEPRRSGDVARCVELALETWPESSNRDIAQRVGCSHTLVNRVAARRAGVETVSTQVVECPVPDTEAVTSKLHEGFKGQVVIGVDHGAAPPVQVISFAGRMTELWGEEPAQEQAPASDTAWVEEADQELVGMGPGQVLLTSGEVEVPVVEDDATPGRRFYSGGTVTLTLAEPALSGKLFAAVMGPKRHRGQDPLERWYTDQALATVCWRWLLESGLLKDVMPTCAGAQLRCLEPCVGGGAWVSGLEAASRGLGGDPSRAAWVVMDADPQAPGLRLWKERVVEVVVGNFLTTPWEGWKFDVVISNPPNSLARDIIEESIRRLDWHGVAAFLLPASWMAAKRRRGWLSLNPPRVVALVPWRPSFEGPAAELQGTGEGSPTQDYALHVWVNGDPPGRTWTGTWMEDTSEVEDGEE